MKQTMTGVAFKQVIGSSSDSFDLNETLLQPWGELKQHANGPLSYKLVCLTKVPFLYLANHLQFIFHGIDHKDFDTPYILTLSINEEGAYEGM